MKLPKITGKELVKLVEKLGFELHSKAGSHRTYKHPDGRRTTIPVHSGEELGPGLLNKIIKRELKLNREKFIKLLKKE